MTTAPPPVPPDQEALRELDALLGQVIGLRDVGTRLRYDTDDLYRLALHRLWIAVGNEAGSYADAAPTTSARYRILRRAPYDGNGAPP